MLILQESKILRSLMTNDMRRYKNIIGEQFDRLTVIDITDKIAKDGSAIWLCQCICGNTVTVSTKKLRNKNTRSCGCLQREIVSNNRKKDLTNMRFGQLVALAPTSYRRHGSIVWDCICDCGNRHQTTAETLLSGHCQSCGCIRSRGNQKIKEILQDALIKFIPEYFVYVDGIRYAFDFAIFDTDGNIACFIEYDGVLHFERDDYHGWNNEDTWKQTQKNDQIKTKYAEDNHISLIRIPYTDFDKLTITYITERINKYV